jgi:hypothetical protein
LSPSTPIEGPSLLMMDPRIKSEDDKIGYKLFQPLISGNGINTYKSIKTSIFIHNLSNFMFQSIIKKTVLF